MGLSQAQVADRVNYIGGTDAAAVLGLSRYKTPLGLWSEKTGKVKPKDKSGELPIIIGDELEDVVARLFMRETGHQVRRVKEVQIHPKYPFLKAQIDRRIVGVEEILECKTASAFKAGEWEGEDVPSEYIVQVMHQLMVTGAKAGWIACLIGGNVDFVYKRIERDEDMIADLEARELRFWHENVLGKKMPAVTEHDDSVLQALFPTPKQGQGEPLTLPDSYDAIIERIKEIGTDTGGEIGKLKAEQDALKNEVKVAMGEHDEAVVGRWRATWKERSSGVKLDTKKLLADKPELIVQYGVERKFRVFMAMDATKKDKKGDK